MILLFRHFCEEFGLTRIIFSEVSAILQSKGLLLGRVTEIITTLISVPSSTKNHGGVREPEMHQTKKGNQYHSWMKAHIGVNTESELVHTFGHLEKRSSSE